MRCKLLVHESDLVKSLICLFTIKVAYFGDLERVSKFYSIQHPAAYALIPSMGAARLRRRRDQAESSFLAKCGAKECVGGMFA